MLLRFTVVGVVKKLSMIGNFGVDADESVIVPLETGQLAYNMANQVHVLCVTLQDQYKISDWEDRVEGWVKEHHYVHPDDKAAVWSINLSEIIGTFTNLFLGTNYVYFLLVLLVTLFFVIVAFAGNFKKDSKKAIFTLCVLAAFVLLFVVCWFLGSPEKLDIIGYEGTDNQGFWAQLSDMMIYACYALVAGVVGCIVWGAIYTRVKK